MKNTGLFLACLLAPAAALSACSGGGSSSTTPVPSVASTPAAAVAPITSATPAPTPTPAPWWASPAPSATPIASTGTLTGTWQVTYSTASNTSRLATGSLPTIALTDAATSSLTATYEGGVHIWTNAVGKVSISQNTCPASFQVTPNPPQIDLGSGVASVIFAIDQTVSSCGFTVTDSVGKTVNVAYSTAASGGIPLSRARHS